MQEEIKSILEKYDQVKYEIRYKDGKYYDSEDRIINKNLEEHLDLVKNGESRNMLYEYDKGVVIMSVDLYEFVLDEENNLTTLYKPNRYMPLNISLNKHNMNSVVGLLLKYREVIKNEGKGGK